MLVNKNFIMVLVNKRSINYLKIFIKEIIVIIMIIGLTNHMIAIRKLEKILTIKVFHNMVIRTI